MPKITNQMIYYRSNSARMNVENKILMNSKINFYYLEDFSPTSTCTNSFT